MDEDKVTFSDLSLSLKVFIVMGWALIGFYAILFIIGFIIGATTV